jgi:hypothetical protein
MPTNAFPRMLLIRQKFPATPPLDIRATLAREFARLRPRLKAGARVAVGVGSRGIANLQAVVAATLDQLQAAGAHPFIVPAMGSHGGATPEGQKEVLAEYGVTEAAMGVPIRAGMDAERIGVTEDGVDVFLSAEALRADGILVINRVKPHTDFRSTTIGSGVIKMLVVGLGKHRGAANFHAACARLGYEQVLRSLGRAALRSAPVLGAVAIVENQRHDTTRLAVLLPDEIEAREGELFVEARQLMPRLPFAEVDLLILDRIGKNISGAGMDPNITGRWVHGYSSLLKNHLQVVPFVRRLFVRDLTPQTHGNAIGIGLADFTTTRLVRAMDARKTFINSLTSLSLNSAKTPIHFDTDRETLAHALASLGRDDPRQARVVRLADTLSLETLEVSEALAEEVKRRDDLAAMTGPNELKFDAEDNLPPLGAGRPVES